MRILDLISKLEEHHNKYGDKEVLIGAYSELCTVTGVTWDFDEGDRIVIIEVEND